MSPALNEMVSYLLVLGLIGTVAWVGYWGERHRAVRIGVYILMGLIGVIMTVLGGLVMGLIAAGVLKDGIAQILPVGCLLGAIGLCVIPAVIPPVRRWLARVVFLGLEPTSIVHTWSLFVYLASLALTFCSLTILYQPEVIIQSLRQMPLLSSAALNAVGFVLFSLAAGGIFVAHPPREVLRQLGLVRISRKVFLVMLGLALAMAAGFHFLESFLTPLLDTQTRETLERIVEAMGTHGTLRHTLITAVVVGLSAGIGEETLFRGLMQPVFGLVPTALLFALIHSHYGPTVLLLELFLIGLLLGLIRIRWNTTAAIVVHAAFDFFAIMSSLLPR